MIKFSSKLDSINNLYDLLKTVNKELDDFKNKSNYKITDSDYYHKTIRDYEDLIRDIKKFISNNDKNTNVAFHDLYNKYKRIL